MCLKKKSKLLNFELKYWKKSKLLSSIGSQFGAYLTLQAESEILEFKVGILSQYAKLLCGSWL